MRISVTALGQAGFRLQFGDSIVYIDPYLTDRVAELEGMQLSRLLPIPVAPHNVTDANWVMITHLHLDHCDPTTLLPIALASPQATFIGPNEVIRYLIELGISENRVLVAPENRWLTLGDGLSVQAVPAVHPIVERDHAHCLKCVGYVIDYEGRKLYHAGDTSPGKEMITALNEITPIDIAMLPVNERNYYREQQGILGNMSIREAFQLAIDLKVPIVVPMHWDMFALNSVFQEEIELLYRLIKPPFQLLIRPETL
jgi:L-ascorbate metabolism protein UlaG (beta-lactamase superfamily)